MTRRLYGRLRAQPAQCVYPTVNQLLQSPGSLAPTEPDMRRRDTRSPARLAMGECLTFDFILNSYTRYRAASTRVSQRVASGEEEEDKSLIGNKSISVLARDN